jgi:hypothetical protein
LVTKADKGVMPELLGRVELVEEVVMAKRIPDE